MDRQVWLVDAGTGNLRSVQHALQTIGAQVQRTDRPEDLQSGGRIVLPGVGAFGRFIAGLESRGLIDALRQAAGRGDPMLGICVGMQAFFDVGLELGEYTGLGLIPGEVVRFAEQEGLKIPHTGWNQIWQERQTPLLAGLKDGDYAYFNHSYYCNPSTAGDVAGATDYGLRYASVVQRHNLYGVQFHPEKSQQVGLTLLANFLSLK